MIISSKDFSKALFISQKQKNKPLLKCKPQIQVCMCITQFLSFKYIRLILKIYNTSYL